jgi:hypothetical protein
MTWLEKSFNFLLGCLCLLFALVAAVVLLPLILICFIVIVTPPPFSLITNLVFPIHFFLGPEGAKTCLQALMSAMRYILDKAAGFFRAVHETT